jgi:hypothetical protein
MHMVHSVLHVDENVQNINNNKCRVLNIEINGLYKFITGYTDLIKIIEN